MNVLLKEAAMADDSRSRLGRGLASLIGDVGTENPAAERAPGEESAFIRHQVAGSAGFAAEAARWVAAQPHGRYDMQDVLALS